MVRYEAFDSAEEMFQYLADQNRKGKEMLDSSPLTADDLAPPSWWMCMSEPGLLIIGEAVDSSYEEDMESIKRARENGYIYGNWYSTAVPEGEFGSNHFSWCLPMDKDAFDGWMAYIRGEEIDVTDPPRWATYTVCPRCGGPMPRAGREGQYPGALSRRDNFTYICSDCGLLEAMEDFEGRAYSGKPYWEETE